MLILGRVLQGIGAAAILPAALAIIAVEFPDDERDGAISVWIATCWGAQALGPLVGGVLVAALGWSAIFWVNLPLGAAALWLTWTSTAESTSGETERRIDVPGLVTLVGGLFLLNFALVEADEIAGSRLALYLAGAAAADRGVRPDRAPVAVAARRPVGLPRTRVQRRRPREPHREHRVRRGRLLHGALPAGRARAQRAARRRAAPPGDAADPRADARRRALGAPQRARDPDPRRHGAAPVAGLMLTQMPASYGVLVVPFVVLGAGIGLQITATAAVAVDEGSGAGEGVASGVYKAASMIGGSLGVAASVTIFQSSARSHFQDLLDGVQATGEQLGQMLSVLTGALRPAVLDGLLGSRTQQVVEDTFRAAVGDAMWLLVAAALVGIVTSWWLLVRGAD